MSLLRSGHNTFFCSGQGNVYNEGHSKTNHITHRQTSAYKLEQRLVEIVAVVTLQVHRHLCLCLLQMQFNEQQYQFSESFAHIVLGNHKSAIALHVQRLCFITLNERHSRI